MPVAGRAPQVLRVRGVGAIDAVNFMRTRSIQRNGEKVPFCFQHEQVLQYLSAFSLRVILSRAGRSASLASQTRAKEARASERTFTAAPSSNLLVSSAGFRSLERALALLLEVRCGRLRSTRRIIR